MDNQVYRRSFAPVLPFLPTLGGFFGLPFSALRPSSWQRHQQHRMDGSSVVINEQTEKAYKLLNLFHVFEDFILRYK